MQSSIENHDIEVIVSQLLNDFMISFHIDTETNRDKLSQFIQRYKVIERDKDKEVYEKISRDSNLQNLSISIDRDICQKITKKGSRCKNNTFKDNSYCKLHLEYQESKETKKKKTEKELCHHIFIKGPRTGEKCNKICICEDKYCYLHKKN